MAASAWYGDGSERVDEILRSAMLWDVMGGVARRSWAAIRMQWKLVALSMNHIRKGII